MSDDYAVWRRKQAMVWALLLLSETETILIFFLLDGSNRNFLVYSMGQNIMSFWLKGSVKYVSRGDVTGIRAGIMAPCRATLMCQGIISSWSFDATAHHKNILPVTSDLSIVAVNTVK